MSTAAISAAGTLSAGTRAGVSQLLVTPQGRCSVAGSRTTGASVRDGVRVDACDAGAQTRAYLCGLDARAFAVWRLGSSGSVSFARRPSQPDVPRQGRRLFPRHHRRGQVASCAAGASVINAVRSTMPVGVLVATSCSAVALMPVAAISATPVKRQQTKPEGGEGKTIRHDQQSP